MRRYEYFIARDTIVGYDGDGNTLQGQVLLFRNALLGPVLADDLQHLRIDVDVDDAGFTLSYDADLFGHQTATAVRNLSELLEELSF